MHPISYCRRLLLGSLVLVAGMSTAVSYGKQPVTPSVPPVAGVVQKDRSGALLVPLGGLVTFDPQLDPKKDVLTDIIVAREDILTVRLDPANPGKLLMTGRAAGLTQLSLVVQGKPRFVYDVLVQPDLNLLRGLIKRTVPSAAVEVQPGIGNVIILSGYVSSPQDADIVERLAVSAVGPVNNLVNAVQVGGGQQVQIDVVVASVDRSMLRQRGFDFLVRGANFRFSSLVSGLLTPAAVDATTSSANLLFQGGVPTQFLGVLQALRSEGIAKFIAEPRVVTQTGRPAFFRAGGQQAVVSQTSGITNPGVQLVPFGTELEVLPIVYGNGMIWMEINPRISAVSQALGISFGGTVSPGFTEQQVRSAVMLESGQTFAIGGLMQNSIQASSSKIPVLGDIPFVGTAFSTVRHEVRESELVILVTPRIVAPMNCDQVPGRLPGRETRSPDDYELFLENILEAPRGQRKVWNGRCYNAAWKSSPTAAQFPCAGNVHTGGVMGGGCANGNCGVGGGNLGIIGPNGIGLANPGALAGSVNPVAPANQLPPVPNVLPPVPQPAVPVNLPAVPGIPVGEPVAPSSERSGSGAESPAPVSLPIGLPPMVVIPQAPQK